MPSRGDVWDSMVEQGETQPLLSTPASAFRRFPAASCSLMRNCERAVLPL